MRTGQTISLPKATPEFNTTNEQIMRRTVEQGIESLRADIVDTREQTDKVSSLALRRFQFLLMGAASG